MPFVEPFLLWGALAVVIPVVIHFCYQKQGKPLPWAAMHWLTEKQQQQSRGFRLDNVLLLIIRCLLLILLAVLLAQPILNWFSKPPTIQKVHLVQPNPTVASNFRFELAESLKKGDKVAWANEQIEPVNDQLTTSQKPGPINPLQLQTAINALDLPNTELHLYLANNQALADLPAITVPTRFFLHTVIDSTRQPQAYLVVKNNQKLFINRTGKLSSSPALDPTLRFQSAPVHSGPIRTLVSYKNPRERQTVKAALAALTDVYALDLQIDDQPSLNHSYNLILSDQLPVKPARQTLYLVSGNTQTTTNPNVIFTSESLTPQTSERVETGQLPEWLGEQLIRFYGLDAASAIA